MMKNKRLFLILLLVSSLMGQTLSAQGDSLFVLLRTLSPPRVTHLYTDAMGQLYAQTGRNTLIKYSADGDSLFRFSDNNAGAISFFDGSNPLTPMMWSEDFQKITFLDRTLNINGRLILTDLNLTDVRAIGLSNQNTIWLYDAYDYKLKNLDYTGRVLRESSPLLTWTGADFNPTLLRQQDNLVFLNDPEQGIYIFDVFGNYVTHIPVKHLPEFQLLEGQVYYRQDETLLQFNLQTLSTRPVFLPKNLPAKAKQWCIGKGRLFVLDKAGKIQVFKF